MSTRKLLLADDSITIQKVVNLTFADEGIEVIAVSDGDSAMEKLAENPDLVMADVNMPGLNGYQLCEKIKQDSSFQNVPVILLVGSFEPFDEDEARRVGADDFLTKPFQSIRQLVAKVTSLLENGSSNGESSSDLQEASSLADTAEFEKMSDDHRAADLGNAGMDDEMIQENQVSSFSLDESAKFETKDDADSEDYGKTQPLSVYDLKEFSFVADAEKEAEAAPENLREETTENTGWQSSEQSFSDEERAAPVSETVYNENSDETSFEIIESVSSDESVRQKNAPAFADIYGDDLLEIPFDEDDFEPGEDSGFEEKRKTANENPEVSYSDNDVESLPVGGNYESDSAENTENIPTLNVSDHIDYKTGETEIYVGNLNEPPVSIETNLIENTESFAQNTNLSQISPELIDAIAERVIEKLSDKVVREIAWEVVPQQADLIIRKMVEEKLREE